MGRLWTLVSSAIVAAIVVGVVVSTRTAGATGGRSYTLRVGDRVSIPSVNQVCDVEVEAGSPELFCARPRAPHHQIVMFGNVILVWKVGNPDSPVWSGRP